MLTEGWVLIKNSVFCIHFFKILGFFVHVPHCTHFTIVIKISDLAKWAPSAQEAHIRTAKKTFCCISGRARKFWTALTGRATQKHKSGRATHIYGPSLYAPQKIFNFFFLKNNIFFSFVRFWGDKSRNQIRRRKSRK